LALYHKYRPQKFSDVIGQEHIKKTITNALAQSNISHAYIFSGPRGIGKTTTARLLAKAINCLNRKNGEFEPCNACQSCIEVSADRSLDVIEIDAASNRGIDEIRELREKIKFSPSSSKYKVYIIDEVHMLTREAFNALLKTLEEPPKHAIFIMATTEAHRLPETILSRAQEFNFKRAGESDTVKYLESVARDEKIEISKDALGVIAKNASGAYRDAISLLDQISSLDIKKVEKQDVLEMLGIVGNDVLSKFFLLLENSEAGSSIELLNELYEKGYDLGQFNLSFIEFLRDKIFLEKRYDLKPWIDKFIVAQNEMKNASIAQLPIEMAIIDVCEKEKIALEYNKAKLEANHKKPEKINPKDEIKERVITEKTSSDTKENSKIKIIDKKTTIKEEKAQPANVSQALSYDDLLKKWPDVISKIKSECQPLMIILSESQPLELAGDTISLGVGSKFYVDKILEPKKYSQITSIIEEVLGGPYKIKCVVKEKNDEDLLNDVVSVFGAEI